MDSAEKIYLASQSIELSENETDPDVMLANVVICDFDRNGNGVKLNRDTIDNWLSTLVDMPIVGKIAVNKDEVEDFTSHNLYSVQKKDENGNEYTDYEFDTDAFGVFKSASIEEVNGRECICAQAKIWKRFTSACGVIKRRIKEGSLHTSWEIAVENYTALMEGGLPTKVINAGRFLGHCLLGADVAPAYDSSGVVDIASKTDDAYAELRSAIIHDFLVSDNNKIESCRKEDEGMEENKNEPIQEETVVEEAAQEPVVEDVSAIAEPENNEGVVEQAELTDEDVRRQLYRLLDSEEFKYADLMFIFPEAKVCWGHRWRDSQTHLLKFTYTIENNIVSIVGDPEEVELVVEPLSINNEIVQRDEALASANARVTELENQVSELNVYKEEHDKAVAEAEKAEHDKQVSALRDYVETSNCFTDSELESEEIKNMISELKPNELKAMIADRIVSKIAANKKTEVETSAVEQKREKVNIVSVEMVNPEDVMKTFFN